MCHYPILLHLNQENSLSTKATSPKNQEYISTSSSASNHARISKSAGKKISGKKSKQPANSDGSDDSGNSSEFSNNSKISTYSLSNKKIPKITREFRNPPILPEISQTQAQESLYDLTSENIGSPSPTPNNYNLRPRLSTPKPSEKRKKQDSGGSANSNGSNPKQKVKIIFEADFALSQLGTS